MAEATFVKFDRLLHRFWEQVPLFWANLQKNNKFHAAFRYKEVFARTFLSPKSYADGTDEELEIKIKEQWEHFKESDLPLILKLVATV
jgi:hypothetical protein